MTQPADQPAPTRLRPALAGMAAAVQAARQAAAALTGLEVDMVAGCAAHDTGWRIVLDMIETKARVGRNDLISSYELIIDEAGAPIAFTRIARRFREDRQAQADGDGPYASTAGGLG
ncbi:MAG: gas vesicle protein GvpO [Pseudomonadota bacterium]